MLNNEFTKWYIYNLNIEKKNNYRVTVLSNQLIDLWVLFLHLDTTIMYPFLHLCYSIPGRLYFFELHNAAFYFLLMIFRNDSGFMFGVGPYGALHHL